MTSKIKVDNIENQCGGAVVTKCGATTTISGSVVKADDIQAADGGNLINQCGTTITLGASGDTINLASGASQTGFGRTGTVDWDTTPKTATFSAVSGNGYFCNTSGGAFTVNLPAGSAGAIVSLADYAATWQTNNLTVSPNGSEKIGSVNANVTLNTEGQSVTFVYVDSTQGWINTMDSTSNVRGNPNLVATGGTITTSGDYKIHTFTGPGTFEVTGLSSTPANNIMSYVILAGGGGGGGSKGSTGAGGSSGAGAGGFREYKGPADCYSASPLNGNPGGTAVTVTATSYPITVGAGGSAGPGTASPNIPGNNGANGSNSIFSTVTATGGGGGMAGPCASQNGVPGGSGSGASGGSPSCRVGGSGNTPPTTPSQGNDGGDSNPAFTGAGGGGAGGTGTPAKSSSGGTAAGGSGVASSITASPVTRAAGGFGQDNSGSESGPNRGNNTGDGGPGATGAGSDQPGGNGGSGIVIIRYKFQ